MDYREIRYYEAAGGIVHYNGKFLVLHKPKLDEIRLPKGHIEPGETPEEAALREVGEESGYIGLKIVASLGTGITEFDHYQKPEHIKRKEFYFLMEPSDTEPYEQERSEEDSARFTPLWVTPEEALANVTFEGERKFVLRAIEHLRG